MKEIGILTLLFYSGLLLCTSVAIFRYLWIKRGKLRDLLLNLTLSFFSLFFMILLIEYIFATFLIKSDGYNFTLSGKKWQEIYWRPINSAGFRDYEHKFETLKETNVLFVVGDSFVAGHGIKKIENRFPNILSRELGTPWSVVVVAKNGWNTLEEYYAIRRVPYRPDEIILSYYLNDIESAAKSLNIKRTYMIQEPEGFLGHIVSQSYFANWTYWRLSRNILDSSYWKYITSLYNNNHVWERHITELTAIIQYANRFDIPLRVVVWPELTAIEESEAFTSRVIDFLRAKNVWVLDLTRHFKGRNPGDLIVNPLDSHPNEGAHREVAQLLFEFLNKKTK